MNHREPPHLSAGARRALHCLSLLLVPVVAPRSVQALSHPQAVAGQATGTRRPEGVVYLPAVGAPALRFQNATPPPDLVTRPSAAAPPLPSLSPTESSVALANAAAIRATVGVTRTPDEANAGKDPLRPADAAAAKRPPAPILPDDTRQQVQPEDFLPYFQIPGTARQPGDVDLILPVPRPGTPSASLPVSSATYTQTK